MQTQARKSSSGILYMYCMIERRIWHMLSLPDSERVTLWTAKWCLLQVLNVAGALITIQPTCQQALFSWNLAATPQQIPCWNLDDHIPKLEELFSSSFFSFIYVYLICDIPCFVVLTPVLKKIRFTNAGGKTLEGTSGILLDSNLIQNDKIWKW